MGTLYDGDNHDIFRRYITDESMDLADPDPPFPSRQINNAFSQVTSSGLLEAHRHLVIETKKACDAVTEQPDRVSNAKQALEKLRVRNVIVFAPNPTRAQGWNCEFRRAGMKQGVWIWIHAWLPCLATR